VTVKKKKNYWNLFFGRHSDKVAWKCKCKLYSWY